jgi:hypothetical protein
MGTQVLEIKDFSLAEKWALLATRSMIFEFIPIASKISLQKSVFLIFKSNTSLIFFRAFIFCSLEAGNIGQARWTLRRGVVQDQSDPEQMHLWRRLKAMEIAAGVFIQN